LSREWLITPNRLRPWCHQCHQQRKHQKLRWSQKQQTPQDRTSKVDQDENDNDSGFEDDA
jgi:hypothetical protein